MISTAQLTQTSESMTSNRQPSSVLAVRYKQCDHMNAKSVMTIIPDKFDSNQLWWAVKSSDLAHWATPHPPPPTPPWLYLPFLCCDLVFVFAHFVLRNSPFGFLDFGFLLEWWFSFWFLWKYGELYYKNNRKLPIPGQIKLILIFSSSAIEFLQICHKNV